MIDPVPEKSAAQAVNKAMDTKKGFGVAASPFNGIKLELGICAILGAMLVLGAEFITVNAGTQLLLLLAYGIGAAAWLMLRTRGILRRIEVERSTE